MAAIFIRTLILYILLTAIFRLMGKRQVGELDVSELICTLLLSEIASLPIDDPDIPLLYAVVPILLIMTFEIIVTFAKTRVNPLKKLFESQPVFLIERGEIREDELARMRITLEELLSECRLQGFGSPDEVYYAILEENGKLSVLPRAANRPLTPADTPGQITEGGILHPLVIDGTVDREEARRQRMTEKDVRMLCESRHVRVEDLFLLGIDDAGNVTVLQKKDKKPKEKKRGRKARKNPH